MKFNHLELTPVETGAWVSWINEYPWEWWVTLNIGVRDFSQKLRQFIFKLNQKEDLQTAHMGFFSERRGFHIHLLSMGDNKKGENLLHVNRGKWEDRWWGMTFHTAKIKIVDSPEGVIKYLVDHVHDPNHLFFDYNRKLLKKRRGGVSPLFTEADPGWAGFKSTGVL